MECKIVVVDQRYTSNTVLNTVSIYPSSYKFNIRSLGALRISTTIIAPTPLVAANL